MKEEGGGARKDWGKNKGKSEGGGGATPRTAPRSKDESVEPLRLSGGGGSGGRAGGA
jgi:hypothetical protein